MKKVALVTCYFMKNYGSVLQAYATQRVLDNLGIENETICIEGLSSEIESKKIKYFISKIFDFDIVKNKLSFVKHKLSRKFNIKGFGDKMKLRDRSFNEFISNFNISERYQSFDELKKGVNSYSSVIVGSDQLWLPSNIAADYYTLNWVPENINKISYATSFGVSSLEPKYEKIAADFLSRINHLSVRELSGKKIIKDITGLNAEIVCDPTLLLTSDDWMEIQSKERLIKGKYIFCYFIGNNPDQRDFVKRLKSITGYKIVSLEHIDEYIKSDENFADEAPYNINPGDFINLIRNSEYVCTDSFHGTVFSILNQRKFFTFKRFKANRKVSTNSRLDSLFDLLGLEERAISSDSNVEKCIKMNIDYEVVNKKLDIFREDSIRFLKKSLLSN